MINEVFYSLQGEGLLVGTPALFIRFQGCNLRCIWCDEKKALDFNKSSKTLKDVLYEVKDILQYKNPNLIVLTGGEPLANDIFLEAFLFFANMGKTIQIETNATILPETIYDALKGYEKSYITLSPKYVCNYFIEEKFFDFNKNIELKIVVDKHLTEDVLRRDYMKPFIERNQLILQPLSEDGCVKFLDKAMMLAEMFNARVIPQMHKLIGVK